MAKKLTKTEARGKRQRKRATKQVKKMDAGAGRAKRESIETENRKYGNSIRLGPHPDEPYKKRKKK